MRFSWKAILLAPLLVPLIASLAMAVDSGRDQWFAFFFFFALSAIFSYGVTVVLFLPALFVVSRLLRLNVWLIGLLGVLLGLAVYFPVAWQSYLASGDNSGPPSGTFLEYLRNESWSESWLFYGGGLVTALAYWCLAKPGTKNEPEASAHPH